MTFDIKVGLHALKYHAIKKKSLQEKKREREN